MNVGVKVHDISITGKKANHKAKHVLSVISRSEFHRLYFTRLSVALVVWLVVYVVVWSVCLLQNQQSIRMHSKAFAAHKAMQRRLRPRLSLQCFIRDTVCTQYQRLRSRHKTNVIFLICLVSDRISVALFVNFNLHLHSGLMFFCVV